MWSYQPKKILQLTESFIQQEESGGYWQITREGTRKRMFHACESVYLIFFFFGIDSYLTSLYVDCSLSSQIKFFSWVNDFPVLFLPCPSKREGKPGYLIKLGRRRVLDPWAEDPEELWCSWRRLQPTRTLRIICILFAFSIPICFKCKQMLSWLIN